MPENKQNQGDQKQQEEQQLTIEQPDNSLVPKFGMEMKIAILNAPIATTFGNYAYFPIPVESARILVNASEFSSYVGHKSTADIISKILNKPVGYTRKELKQKVGQIALVFKLKKRAPEGKILNEEDVQKIGYEFGILYRLK